jgi:hypothetical protein
MKFTVSVDDRQVIAAKSILGIYNIEEFVGYLLEREIYHSSPEHYSLIQELCNKFNQEDEGYIGVDPDALKERLVELKEVLACSEDSLVERIRDRFFGMPSYMPSLVGLEKFLEKNRPE